MHALTEVLTAWLTLMLRLCLWALAALAAFAVTALVLTALGVAALVSAFSGGRWRLGRGPTDWARELQARWAARASGATATHPGADRSSAPPFARRRFGRAAGRQDVSDVTPREVH